MNERTPDPEVTADDVVEALRDLDEVRLHEQSVVGTHLPGRRVPGVRLTGQDAEVHVAVVHPTTVEEAAEKVRAALGGLPLGSVHVVVEDLVLPDDGPEEGPTPKGVP